MIDSDWVADDDWVEIQYRVFSRSNRMRCEYERRRELIEMSGEVTMEPVAPLNAMTARDLMDPIPF